MAADTRVERDADELVEKAREQADAVLDVARDLADSKLDPDKPVVEARADLDRARAREDKALQAERAAADEVLRLERVEQARTLAALLPLERQATDRLLLTERARSDVVLANRDDFLGMVSHDLRNLLSGVVLNATELSDHASDSEEGRRTVVGMARIQRYVGRMTRLIGDLVDVVSIDAGKLALNPSRGDAAVVVAEAVEVFAVMASERGIVLEASTVKPGLMADFDHDRLLQVVVNLITNAIKFTPKGGTISIQAACVGPELRLTVSDTGSGIPSEMLESVFERFWQVGKNDRRGLGLGLYISRCIVAALGGKIWAESKVGEGSQFHVVIPCSAAKA